MRDAWAMAAAAWASGEESEHRETTLRGPRMQAAE
jgi:hypothetical protein